MSYLRKTPLFIDKKSSKLIIKFYINKEEQTDTPEYVMKAFLENFLTMSNNSKDVISWYIFSGQFDMLFEPS